MVGATKCLQNILSPSFLQKQVCSLPCCPQAFAKPLLCVRLWAQCLEEGQRRMVQCPPLPRPLAAVQWWGWGWGWGCSHYHACLLASKSKGGCDKCQEGCQSALGAQRQEGAGEECGMLHWLDFSHLETTALCFYDVNTEMF